MCMNVLGELPSGALVGQQPRRTGSCGGGIQAQHRPLRDSAQGPRPTHYTTFIDCVFWPALGWRRKTHLLGFSCDFSFPHKHLSCFRVNVFPDFHPGALFFYFYTHLHKVQPSRLRRASLSRNFPVSERPIRGRHAAAGQRCVNLTLPKHTQCRCQELDYLKQVSAQSSAERFVDLCNLSPGTRRVMTDDERQVQPINAQPNAI